MSLVGVTTQGKDGVSFSSTFSTVRSSAEVSSFGSLLFKEFQTPQVFHSTSEIYRRTFNFIIGLSSAASTAESAASVGGATTRRASSSRSEDLGRLVSSPSTTSASSVESPEESRLWTHPSPWRQLPGMNSQNVFYQDAQKTSVIFTLFIIPM